MTVTPIWAWLASIMTWTAHKYSSFVHLFQINKLILLLISNSQVILYVVERTIC